MQPHVRLSEHQGCAVRIETQMRDGPEIDPPAGHHFPRDARGKMLK